jgi:hypothetical protein
VTVRRTEPQNKAMADSVPAIRCVKPLAAQS